MHELDSLAGRLGRAEGLESEHGPDDSLHGEMILLHTIIQVFDLADFDLGLGLRLERLKGGGNGAATRNGRLAAIKAFMRYIELRVPSALEQAWRIHAIPGKRYDQKLVRHLTMDQVDAVLNAPDLATRLGSGIAPCCISALPAAYESPSWSGLYWRILPYNPRRVSAFTEKGVKSASFRCGNRRSGLCGPGWRYEVRFPYRNCSSMPRERA